MRRSHNATMGAGGGRRRGSPVRVAALFLVALLIAGGSGLLVAAYTAEPPRPPQPAAAAAPPDLDAFAVEGTDTVEGKDPNNAAPAPLDRSVPVRIRIPKIDVNAKLLSLGVEDNGEVEVPPLHRADKAGWYKHGVTPGEPGNAVIIGHVDSRKIGPAVFFKLGKLTPGDRVAVTRKDGLVARFRVDGVRAFPKTEFPAELVYGPSDQAGLRIVTCGGKFDKKTRNYLDNVIVFATLESVDE